MQKVQRFRRVIVESPYSGDVPRNEIYLQRAIRDCIERGETPYASHQMLTRALNDLDPSERAIGMRAGRDWYEAAETCVVYTDYGASSGMQIGVSHAREIGLKIEERSIGANPETSDIPPPVKRKRGRKAGLRNGETKRRAVELRRAGHTQIDVARILDCTESNVRAMLHADAEEAELDDGFERV